MPMKEFKARKQFNCMPQIIKQKLFNPRNFSTKTLAGFLIAQVLWPNCETCDQEQQQEQPQQNMASLPQGAFAACKLREQYRERDYILSRMKSSGADKNDFRNSTADNEKQLEYKPVKYNEKLMNSVWGLYNRYSPHNVKKNEFVPPKY